MAAKRQNGLTSTSATARSIESDICSLLVDVKQQQQVLLILH